MMFSRIQTALAGLVICAVMSCTQLTAAADTGNPWADYEVAQGEAGTKHDAWGSDCSDPEEPVLVQSCAPAYVHCTAAFKAVSGTRGKRNAIRITTIRAPPAGSDNSA